MALYLDVARALQDRIAAGEYPVGSLLPTEHRLAENFAVSRQTVRQAIGHLRGMKLLSARKGIGTRVEAAQPETAYHQTLQSLGDLFQFAADAQFRVRHAQQVILTGREAEAFGCRPGRTWLRLDGLREVPGKTGAPAPVAVTTVLIDARYAAIAETPRIHTRALFAQLQDRFGVTVTEVLQDIEATLLTAEHAQALGATPATAALLITRRFFGAGRALLMVSRNLHAGTRFRYSMAVRREA
jgi:DNA-binding GntR family transcriptional regulator